MSKSPINILQEHCMKNNLLLKFEPYTINGGTHANTFQCIVYCNQIKVAAKATNKKDAKKIASEKMLAELSIDCNDTNKIGTVENGTVIQPLAVFNNVGKLQEWCTQNRMDCKYEDLSMSGTAHNPKFEAAYSIPQTDIRETATAKSKKEAKNMAAKKILERLGLDTKSSLSSPISLEESFKALGVKVANLNINDLPDTNENNELSSKAIVKRYKSITGMEKKETVDFTTKNYPYILKSSFEDDIRNLFLRESKNLINKLENEVSMESLTAKVYDDVKRKFSELLEILNVTYEIVDYQCRIKVAQKNAIVAIKLSTKPQIIEIICDMTRMIAVINAILEILKSLVIFLN